MRPATKMLMISSRNSENRGGENRGAENNERRNGYEQNPRNEYGNNRGEHGNKRMEDNYRRTENEGGVEMSVGYDEPESRRRYRRYDDGRFAPHNEYEGANDGYSHYPPPPHYIPPPIYEGGEMEGRRRRSGRMEMNYPRQEEEPTPTNLVGFDGGWNRAEKAHDYRQDAEYRRMGEVNKPGRSERIPGMPIEKSVPKFNRDMALEWTGSMENADGTSGPHWSMEQTNKVMTQKGIQCDPVEFWAVMNAIYSDDATVAKKHNVNTVDYYADRAKAWLEDKDAVEDKASAYFTYIVKH